MTSLVLNNWAQDATFIRSYELCSYVQKSNIHELSPSPLPDLRQ